MPPSSLQRFEIAQVLRDTRSVHRLAVLVGLVACAPSPRELRAPVDAELGRRLGDRVAPVDVAALLAAPLDAATAVKIALANSPRLAAAYDELGIAGGDVAAALGLGALTVDLQARFGGGGHQLELDAVQNLVGLIGGGRRRDAARAELAATRAHAVATALRLAARVEIAFRDVIAAQQELELRRIAFTAADTAADIRERMFAAGTTTALAQAHDRDAREQASIEVARAEAAIAGRRAALEALMGIDGGAWTATGTLPELPAAPPALDALEDTAVRASLDLEAGRARVTAAASRASDERLHRWLPELGLGVSVIEDDFVRTIGPAVRLGIPLLDWRSGPIARAEAQQQVRTHELAATAIELRAAVRGQRAAALAAYGEAKRLRDVVLPLRQQIVDETLRHYNAMDADPFELIVARRELVDAGHQYLDALRRYHDAITATTALARGVSTEATP